MTEAKNYWELYTRIWKFNDIQSQLKEWRELLISVKDKVWEKNDLYQKFKKEYDELYKTIQESINSEKSFSIEERAKIKKELDEIIVLDKIDKKWILKKDINKMSLWSKEDIILALKFISINWISKLKDANSDSIWSIDSLEKRDIFQNKLLDNYFNWVWFNKNWEVKSYSKEKWFYIWTLLEIDRNVKSNNSIYLNWVFNTNIDKISFSWYINSFEWNWQKLFNNLGASKSSQIIDYLKSNPNVIPNSNTLIWSLEQSLWWDLNKLKLLDIKNLTPEQAQLLLNESQKKYSTHGSNFVDNLSVSERNTYSAITSKAELNLFQEKLIEKIIWNKSFWNWFIVWFLTEKWWHYIIKASDFENKLKKTTDFQDLNTKSLLSYYNYISKSQWSNISNYLAQNIPKDKLKELKDFIDRQKDKSFFSDFINNAKDKSIFSDFTNTLTKAIATTIETVKNFVTDAINSIFKASTPEELNIALEIIIKNSNLEQKKQIIDELVKDIVTKNAEFKNIFLTPLLAKWVKKEEAEKIVNEFIVKVKQNLTPEKLWDAYKLITEFNKEHKLNLSHSEVADKWTKIKEAELKKEKFKTLSEIQKLEIELQKAKKDKNEVLIKKLTEELEKLKVKDKALNTRQKANQTTMAMIAKTSDKKAQQIWSSEIKYSDYIEDLSKQDPELKTQLEQYKKEKESFKKEYWLDYSEITTSKPIDKKEKEVVTKTQSNKVTENINNWPIPYISPSNINYPDWSVINYIETSSWYQINSNWVSVSITSDEFDLVKNNPEAKENLINFKQTLDELNIDKLWSFRENIFKILSNGSPIWFDTKDNYLSPLELKRFLLNILKSVWIDLNPNLDIANIKQKFKDVNQSWTVFETKQVSIYWWIIETEFCKRFVWEWSRFNEIYFESCLKGIEKQTV